MKRLLLPLCLLAGLAAQLFADAPLNQLTDAEKTEGWKLLFDGKDAAAWRGYGKDKLPDGWKVEDGALVTKGGQGDIITKDEFESFEFSLDWKIGEGGNSGLMFKVQETKNPSFYTGPEVQIQDNIKGHDPEKAGWLYQFYSSNLDATKPVGEWNTMVLKCQKTATGTYKCEQWMNGRKYCEYEIGSAEWTEKLAKSKFAKWEGFGKADKGHLCLQDHGDTVAFRNIRIRELSALK